MSHGFQEKDASLDPFQLITTKQPLTLTHEPKHHRYSPVPVVLKTRLAVPNSHLSVPNSHVTIVDRT